MLLALGLLASLSLADPQPIEANLREGDVIFHRSTSEQSGALREATGSDWTHVGVIGLHEGKWVVIEAIQPVTITPLKSFIRRGQDGRYQIRRLRDADALLTPAKTAELKQALLSSLGKTYDIFFEWSDERIYCSELVYKAFERSLGVRVGRLQKMGDLKLDGPLVQELIRKRLRRVGRDINLDEPVITPVAQLEDPAFITILQNL